MIEPEKFCDICNEELLACDKESCDRWHHYISKDGQLYHHKGPHPKKSLTEPEEDLPLEQMDA